jgi:hypothetical protein
MAQHSLCIQGLDANSDIAEFDSVSSSPVSETISFSGAGTRSSTWPVFINGSHNTTFDYIEEDYDSGIDNQTQYAEPETSDFESVEPCEYDQATSFQLLTRTSDFQAHHDSEWLHATDISTQDSDTSNTVGRHRVLPIYLWSTWLPHLSLPLRKSMDYPQCELLSGSPLPAGSDRSLHHRSVLNHYIDSPTDTSVHTPG